MIELLNKLTISDALFAGIFVGLSIVVLFWILSFFVQWTRNQWEKYDDF